MALVVPRLGTHYANGLGYVGVGDGKAVRSVAFNRVVVCVRRVRVGNAVGKLLANAVFGLLARMVLVHANKGALPVVVGVELADLARPDAVD